jgi:Ni/Co efflux regulator RcnB
VRTFLITLTALGAVAVALPTVSANAQDRTVVVTKDRDHDRGLHRGWTRGRHEGWRHHNDKVVVIKKSRHHHYD